MIGSGAAPESKGLMVYAAGGASKLTVEDSIVRGFPLAWERLINGSGGTASLTLENDDIAAEGANNATGSPSRAANIDLDPLFVDPAAGDYHLRFGSPAIDSGGICSSVCKAVPDLDGLIADRRQWRRHCGAGHWCLRVRPPRSLRERCG